MRIGVISDTHGWLRPEALSALAGADRILHAGDVGDPAVLSALAAVAPVSAVRGNCDRGDWASALPVADVVDLGGVSAYLLHDRSRLDLDPRAACIGVVVSGHTHQPLAERRDGVLYLNPGSAGPRRFHLPVTVAILHGGRGGLSVEFVDLLAGGG